MNYAEFERRVSHIVTGLIEDYRDKGYSDNELWEYVITKLIGDVIGENEQVDENNMNNFEITPEDVIIGRNALKSELRKIIWGDSR